jgi:hydrogenase-4 component B
MAVALGNIADPATLAISGAALAALSGVPGIFLKRAPGTGQLIATLMVVFAAIVGLSGAFSSLFAETTPLYTISWGLPFGHCEIGLDHLSAVFLLPILLISACCSIYATGYWPAPRNPLTSVKLTFFFGLLTAALIILVIAQDSILFLIAWEVMALSAYFVLTTEDHNPEVRKAGIIYLVTTHTGTLALFAMFSLLRLAASSHQFSDMAAINPLPPLAAAIFCTALFGFGLKAGLMPLHVWLPTAHANAPSHVSALMSGVLIKTGIYGFIRVLSFFPHPPLWWGVTVLVAGIVSAILGVAFALGQHDLKRLLAYHSIENIGIITLGIGIALVGRTSGNPLLTTLGMAGALLHTLNHALFKSLLFLSAGAAIHATHTRRIDRMGGLAKAMPWTAGLFLLGAVAICGLPPLNGFASEYLIYLGVFSGVNAGSGPAVPIMALAAPALALVGALAVACFVKVFGIVFLGIPRSSEAEDLREAGWSMRAPMLLLAALCVVIGLFPQFIAKLLQPALYGWAPAVVASGHTILSAAPLGWITILGMTLLLVGGVLALAFRQHLKVGTVSGAATWGCGYLKPTARMQYSASSFAEMLIKLLAGALRPHAERGEIKGPFPQPSRFMSHVPEAVLELLILPFFKAVDARFSTIRRLQHGQLHLYILYVFVTLCILLAWAM